MKYGFTMVKLIDEGKVVNVSLMPDYNEMWNESSWQVGDDVLYFNHTTKKWRLERFEWDDEEGDWLQMTPDLGHKEARQVAFDEQIIYIKE